VEVTLLKCSQYCAKGILLIVFVLAAGVNPSFAAVEAVQTFVDSTWTNEIYYVTSLSGYYGQTKGYDAITVWITAVDEYELYINGDRVDTADVNDNNWETVEEYPWNVSGNVIHIGVKVTNHGQGHGNGLQMDIQAGTDQLGTTTKIRDSVRISGEFQDVPISWWTLDVQAKAALGWGDDWCTFDYAKDIFTDTGKTSKMRRAMLGSMGEIDHTFNPQVQVITGYLHSNVDIGDVEGGGISLRRIEGENIALGKPADDVKLTDGDLIRGFQYMARPLNDTRKVDLGMIYRVDRMILFTGGDKASDYEEKSLRGYSVEISLDEFRWEEVGVIHNIGVSNADEGGYDNYTVIFPPEWARYLRYHVTETRIEMPWVGEIMVGGLGYVLEGTYESDWFNFDAPGTIKNFGMVNWEGEVPDGTTLTIQTQTKNGEGGLPSPWSAPMSAHSFSFDSPEPATHFKYRINLSTQDPFRSPSFKRIAVEYSSADQPVATADGYVTPNRVAMGADSTFTYVLSYTLNAGQNLGTIILSVPGFSVLNQVYSSDSQSVVPADYTPTIDSLYISFRNPVTDSGGAGADTLYISFNTKLLGSSHQFKAFLYNSSTPMNDNAGPVYVWENKQLGSETVIVSSILKGILSNVKAVPKVFTPNSDNKNDFTVIEFTLAKVVTNVKINIYSTSGSLVTTIAEKKMGNSSYSASSIVDIGDRTTEGRDLPGYWDGKDNDGELVPPGIYVFQVIAETDEKDEIEGGTVVVAY